MSTTALNLSPSQRSIDKSGDLQHPAIYARKASQSTLNAGEPKPSSHTLSIDATAGSNWFYPFNTTTRLLDRLMKARAENGAPFSELDLKVDSRDGYINMGDGPVNLALLASWLQARGILKLGSTLKIRTDDELSSLDGTYQFNLDDAGKRYHIAKLASRTGTNIVLHGSDRSVKYVPSQAEQAKASGAAKRSTVIEAKLQRKLSDEAKALIRDWTFTDAIYDRFTDEKVIIDDVKRFSGLTIGEQQQRLNRIHLD